MEDVIDRELATRLGALSRRYQANFLIPTPHSYSLTGSRHPHRYILSFFLTQSYYLLMNQPTLMTHTLMPLAPSTLIHQTVIISRHFVVAVGCSLPIVLHIMYSTLPPYYNASFLLSQPSHLTPTHWLLAIQPTQLRLSLQQCQPNSALSDLHSSDQPTQSTPLLLYLSQQ